MNLFIKQKETHRLRERTYGCWVEGQGKGQLGSGDGHGHTAAFKMDNPKWITNKDLLYNT